jgi:hypothetical protein
MASAAEYSRGRWIVMQVVLWVILAATVGLAALVDNGHIWLQSAGLGKSTTLGTISFRLPEHWKISRGSGATVAMAAEPGGSSGTPGRTISIIRLATGQNMLPLEFLQWAGLVDNSLRVTALDGSDWPSATICGWPAESYLLSDRRYDGFRTDQPGVESSQPRTLIACAVLPGGDAVAVAMDVMGPANIEDGDLLDAVAASIVIKGVPPAPAAGGVVNLPNGVRITIGSQGTILPSTDAKLTGRDVVFVQSNRSPLLVQIEPYTQFGDQEAQSAADALAMHEPAWSGAAPVAMSGKPVRQWRVTPAAPAMLPVSQQAYVAVNADGRGLIAIFHTLSPMLRGGLDQTWTEMASGIAFGRSVDADYPAMLAAGAAVVQKLEAEPTPLIAMPDGTWWQWSRPDESGAMSMIGWSRFDRRQRFLLETRRLLWTDDVGRWITQWAFSRDSRTLVGFSTTLQTAGAPDASMNRPPVFRSIVSQVATMTETQLSLINERMQIRTVDRPAQFVHGPILTAVFGRIAINPDIKETLVLRTDWPAGWERAPSAWDALSVFVRPVTAPSASPPADALRGVDVEVNGSGETSRWYFHPDGSFDHAELTGGVIIRPGDADQIRSAFAHDPRMNPDSE